MCWAGFTVLGAIATIAFVASDSSCNSATNLSSGVGVAQAGFCGHVQGFETGGFVILAAGAVLLALGSLILPVLRDRDARRAAAADSSASGATARTREGVTEP